jgi:hypothetical protein
MLAAPPGGGTTGGTPAGAPPAPGPGTSLAHLRRILGTHRGRHRAWRGRGLDPHRSHPSPLRCRLGIGPGEIRTGRQVLDVVVHVSARWQCHAGVFHLASDRGQDHAHGQRRPLRHAPSRGPSRRSLAGQPHCLHPPWRIRRPLGTVLRGRTYRRRGVHSWSRPPEPAPPAGAVPTHSGGASHCEPTPAQHDRPCDAVVGFITWLTNRPNSPLRTNDSAHFEENSIAYSAECSR